MNGGKRLLVSSLPPEQRRIITSLIAVQTFEPTLSAFRQLNKRLASVQTSTLMFRPAVLPNGEAGEELVHRFQGNIRMLELTLCQKPTADTPLSKTAGAKRQSAAAPSDMVAETMPAKPLMAQLSKRIGETLQADSELAERRIYVRLQKVTAPDILAALAECEGWKWGGDAEGGWYLASLSPKLPATLPELTAYLPAVLPHDFQRFLKPGKPSKDWLPTPPAVSKGKSTFDRMQERIPDIQASRRDRLFASLKRFKAKNRVIDFAGLTDIEKNALLTIHVWESLFGLGNVIDIKLLSGKLSALQKKPEEAWLSFGLNRSTSSEAGAIEISCVDKDEEGNASDIVYGAMLSSLRSFRTLTRP